MAAYSYASKSLKRYFKYTNNSGFIKQTKIPSPKDDNNMLKLFKELTPVHVAEETFMKIVTPINRRERLSIEECSGRVLAEDVIARTNVPHYKRAAMDGYALQAEETLGASRTSPALLNRSETIGPQTCVRVHTGSPLPDGADAVIMIEDTEAVDHDLVEIRAQVHPYENVGEIGEDIQEGEFVFREGHLLRPVDISVLASLRLKHVTVHQKPIVSIIPTGDELIPRNRRELPEPGEIIETNTLMTELYAKKWGATTHVSGIILDDPELIRNAIKENLGSDMIILCGGTSVGERDHTPTVIEEMGRILTRGIKASPGKPTTLAEIKERPVLCMPGYPVAGYVALQLFAKPAIKKLAHLPQIPENRTKLPLTEKISSRIGYLTFARIKIENNTAKPVMTSGASILSSITRSDGYTTIPENTEGYEKGEAVEIILTE